MIVMHPPNPSLPCAHCPIHASQGGWEESQGTPTPTLYPLALARATHPLPLACFHPSGCCHLIHMEIFPFIEYVCNQWIVLFIAFEGLDTT